MGGWEQAARQNLVSELVRGFSEMSEPVERCRSYALKCLRIAQNASSSPEKLALLEMAQGGLRKKLQSDGERIQNDIARYAELSQQVMQLTTIISDNVKKLDVSL
jgi:hypothetical protein